MKFEVNMMKLWIFITIAVVPFLTAYRLNDKNKYQLSQKTGTLTGNGSRDNVESGTENGRDLSDKTDQSPQLYQGQSQFAVSLLHAVQKTEPKKNHFFSPHSTYRALLLAYFGAEGDTRKQLERALHLDWAKSKYDVGVAYQMESKTRARRSLGEIQFNSVDKVYVTDKAELNTRITDLLADSFEKMDFSDAERRREEINAFVEEVTQGTIADLLEPGSILPSTNIVLANAAFFKGTWATKFDQKHTTAKTFNGFPKANVEMMHVKGSFNYGVIEELQVEYLELPYSVDDASISMLIYLPLENSPTAIDEILSKFSVETIQEALTKGDIRGIDVEFPKIFLNGSYVLTNVLAEMGVTNLFATSDLSGFSTTTDFHFEDVLHKAHIEIDEDGATAAAATVTNSRSLLLQFHCDHPFLFMINDRVSTEVLFAGVYRGPN